MGIHKAILSAMLVYTLRNSSSSFFLSNNKKLSLVFFLSSVFTRQFQNNIYSVNIWAYGSNKKSFDRVNESLVNSKLWQSVGWQMGRPRGLKGKWSTQWGAIKINSISYKIIEWYYWSLARRVTGVWNEIFLACKINIKGREI